MRKVSCLFFGNKAVHQSAQNPLPVHFLRFGQPVIRQNTHERFGGHRGGVLQNRVITGGHLHNEPVKLRVFRCKQPVAFRQCGYGSIAVLVANGIQQTVPLRPQRRQTDLCEKRIHAFDMRIQRRRFDIQLLHQFSHGKRRKALFLDKLRGGTYNDFFVESLMKHPIASILISLGLLYPNDVRMPIERPSQLSRNCTSRTRVMSATG